MAGPSGTVTFLFTDVEGSTRMWQQGEEAMRAALARHDELLVAVITEHGGTVFSTMGDGMAAAFGSAYSAVAAALAAQRLLVDEVWSTVSPLRVRMGLHTGEAEVRSGDYFGTAVNRAARLMAIGHGGQVLCSSATAEMVGDAVLLVDLGEHRLRDLDRPMRVYQAGEGTFAPLRSLDVMPGNLPFLASSFVGRQMELAAVAKAVGSSRLVTVTGVGGVGKSRLALQVAAGLVAGFADGAWLCELAAASSNDELAQVVAIGLGVVHRAQMSLSESIVDFLRPRQLLVVLDNCEHLLDGAAELVEAILAGAPGVRVLVTSREALGIPGEHVWPLRSLALPSELLGAAGSDAVTLFAERALAADPNFVLDDRCVPAVVEVCRRLDGIPLAIELAAARVAAMNPAEIAGHLDERFRLLTGGQRGRVERHQTLRAAVEWSYSLLDTAERVVFDGLGVFPASFDELAAVAVCAGDGIERWDVIDALASLVAKSMVGVERSGDTTRYQLLETLRHFARDQAGQDLEALRRRHAVYYADFAQRAGAGLASPEELAWRPRLAAELDNLRTATGWACAAPSVDDVGLAVALLEGLLTELVEQPSWRIQGWAGAALARLDDLHPAQRTVVLAAVGVDAYQMGQLDRAKILGGRVIAESETFTPALLLAIYSVSLATAADGDLAGAMTVLIQGRQRLQTAGAGDRPACVLLILAGWLAHRRGDHDTARSESRQAVTFARRLGAPSLLSAALSSHANIVCYESPDEALAEAEECLRLIEAGAGDAGYSPALQTAAVVCSAKDDIASAARAISAAVVHDARIGKRLFVAVDVALAALVLAAHPDGLRAVATLGGTVSGPVFGHIDLYIRGVIRDHYDQALDDVAAALGAHDYADAQQRGAAMTYDEIISFTLTHLARVVDSSSTANTPTG